LAFAGQVNVFTDMVNGYNIACCIYRDDVGYPLLYVCAERQ